MWNYDRFRDIQTSSDEEDKPAPAPAPAMHPRKQYRILREQEEAKCGQTIEAIKSNSIRPLDARVLEDLLYENYIFGSGNDMLTYDFLKNLGNFPIQGTFQDACLVDDFAWLLERIYRKNNQLTRVTPPVWTKLQQNASDPGRFPFVYLDCYDDAKEKKAELCFEYHCEEIWTMLSALGQRAQHQIWHLICVLPTPTEVNDQPKRALNFEKIETPVKFETHLTKDSELKTFGTMPVLTTEATIERNLKRWYYQPHSDIETEQIRKAYAAGEISDFTCDVMNSGLVQIPPLQFQSIHGIIFPNWSFEIKTAWLESNGIEWDKSKDDLLGLVDLGADQALKEHAHEGERPPFEWWPNKYPTRRDLVGDPFYIEGLQKIFREDGTFSHFTTLYRS